MLINYFFNLIKWFPRNWLHFLRQQCFQQFFFFIYIYRRSQFTQVYFFTQRKYNKSLTTIKTVSRSVFVVGIYSIFVESTRRIFGLLSYNIHFTPLFTYSLDPREIARYNKNKSKCLYTRLENDRQFASRVGNNAVTCSASISFLSGFRAFSEREIFIFKFNCSIIWYALSQPVYLFL